MYTTLVASLVLISTGLIAYMGVLALRRFTPSPVGTSALTLPPVLSGDIMVRFRTPGVRTPEPAGPARISGLSKLEAENLLDWLEATGHANREVRWAEGTGFTVSWN